MARALIPDSQRFFISCGKLIFHHGTNEEQQMALFRLNKLTFVRNNYRVFLLENNATIFAESDHFDLSQAGRCLL